MRMQRETARRVCLGARTTTTIAGKGEEEEDAVLVGNSTWERGVVEAADG